MPVFFSKGREAMSSYTHFIGAVFSACATVVLIIACIFNNSELLTIVSCSIFGVSMISLYTASAYYHYAHGSDKKLLHLRKLDHAMIYVLIAGTYTPIALFFMNLKDGVIFTFAVWFITVLGIATKLLWFNAPRWFYTSLYLILGWSIVFEIEVFQNIPTFCTFLIAGGGISYSFGAILYIIKKPNIGKYFGFHEIFHLFIMLGTLMHFSAVLFYIALG